MEIRADEENVLLSDRFFSAVLSILRIGLKRVNAPLKLGVNG
jgi:hypothetical protein